MLSDSVQSTAEKKKKRRLNKTWSGFGVTVDKACSRVRLRLLWRAGRSQSSCVRRAEPDVLGAARKQLSRRQEKKRSAGSDDEKPADVRAESPFQVRVPVGADVTARSRMGARSSSTQRSPWLWVESSPGLRHRGSRPGGNRPAAAACSGQGGSGERRRQRGTASLRASQNRRDKPDRSL